MPLGIIFSDGTSVTLNTDGTIAGVNDFTKPTCENTTLDGSTAAPERTPMIKMTAAQARENLKKSIDYLSISGGVRTEAAGCAGNGTGSI